MKKKLLLALPLLILIIFSGFLAYRYFLVGTPDPLLSPDQQTIRNEFGPPDQFVVTYMPHGSGTQTGLNRMDIWYYKDAGKKLSFIAGVLSVSEDYSLPEYTLSTSLKPENFNYFMNYSAVKNNLSDKEIYRLDYEPVETYASPQALFIVENGRLTYFQTLYAQKP